MPEDWEVLGRGKAAPGERPTVTLQKNGRLALNHAAYLALGEPAYIELLYSRSTKRLGLRLLAPDADLNRGYPVQKRHRARSYIISPTAVLARAGIAPPERAVRYLADLDGGVLSVDLSPKTTGGSMRVTASGPTTGEADVRSDE